ncbi:MAG: hypothetical protein Q8O16_00930, partial [Dehalococcoidia bacterium]|nr:hypothetical protein [Dehalococcoidia bacterium]
DKWKSLPPDVQQGIMSVSGLTGTKNEGDVWDRVAASTRKSSQDKGVEITTVAKDELAKWYNFGKPIWDEYAKQLDSKGLPGTKLVEETIRLVEQYKK